MNLQKIRIVNFKSIKEVEFEIKKYGSSYTTMLIGMNESGKSNILEAMSFLKKPDQKFDYLAYHNQKDEDNDYIDLWFDLAFENKDTCIDILKKQLINGELLHFELTTLTKNVFLSHKSESFIESYRYDIKKLTPGLFVRKANKTETLKDGQQRSIPTIQVSKTKDDETYIELTEKNFKDHFAEIMSKIVKRFEPSVTFWKPSKEYLINSEDLHDFAEDPSLKPALKNIFMLAGYVNTSDIKDKISTIDNGQRRSKLKSKLEDELNQYLKNVWKHDIDVVIDITETGILTLSIKDKGEKNLHDRLPIESRSEGARHFLSLILSLSIESKKKQLENQLILIDEPEAHLHPSGIRDLRDELLKIGINNYLFVSTHSPFLIDRKRKERNIIIKKDHEAMTHKIHIESDSMAIDDEVLREAFGIEVYKDLLNPHSILVEGASDKKILQKILNIRGKNHFGITNGHGSNIDTLASKLNEAEIALLVIVDDDKDGKLYKQKIIKIGGSYSTDNVMTIRDLVGALCDGATIEDTLGKGFVESTFKKCFEETFDNEESTLDLDESKPFIYQIKVYLNQKGLKNHDDFIECFKNKLADNLVLTKTKYKENFPLLTALSEAIIIHLS